MLKSTYDDTKKILTNFNLAVKFVREIPEVDYDCYDGESKHSCHNRQEEYNDLIEKYMDKFNETISKKSVKIYRRIALPPKEKINCGETGVYWSFSKDGIGTYGTKTEATWKEVDLIANVRPQDIDWLEGFNSFMHYGEDQWECALNLNSPIKITHINYKKLSTPLLCNSGTKYTHSFN